MKVSTMKVAVALALLVSAVPVAAEVEPGPENDYGRSRPGGLIIEWRSLLGGTGLEGWRESGSPQSQAEWTRDGNSVRGHIPIDRKTRLVTGDTSWKNYEFSVHVTPKKGTLQFPFRIEEDGKALYFVEFDHAWQSINLSKRDRETGVVKLSVVNFALETDREYHLVISARQRSLTTYIDGKLINQVTDDSYSKGGVGLAMWWTTTAIFRDPKIRHYKWP